MRIDISASVGRGGVNRPNDVRTIQAALNRLPPASGGPIRPLAVDGICGPKTIDAIQKFPSCKFSSDKLGWSLPVVGSERVNATSCGCRTKASLENLQEQNYCSVLVGSIDGARWGRAEIDEALYAHHDDLAARLRRVAATLAASWVHAAR